MGDEKQGSSRVGGRRRRSREFENMSLEIRNYPRDLLQAFVSSDRNTSQVQEKESAMEEEGGEEKDLELNLGLSLDGRFGVDKSHKGLVRSSSIALAACFKEGEEVVPAALARTSSLPTVTEEEWRRRNATLRRMEAKRRRCEKQRGVSGAGDSGIPGPGKSIPDPDPGPVKAKAGFFRSLQGLLAHQHSQGSAQGSSFDLEYKTHRGSGSGGEAKSPGSSPAMQMLMQERGRQTKQAETSEDHRKKEAGSSSGMEDMPSVFTMGDGPTGRKVEGILYRYSKGEEVRIMCVCHGSFYSPADFVKHAGGTDVDHPLRHIVVNPSSSPFP